MANPRVMIEQYEDLLKRAVALEDDLLKLNGIRQDVAVAKSLGYVLDSIGDAVADLGWIVKMLKGQR